MVDEQEEAKTDAKHKEKPSNWSLVLEWGVIVYLAIRFLLHFIP